MRVRLEPVRGLRRGHGAPHGGLLGRQLVGRLGSLARQGGHDRQRGGGLAAPVGHARRPWTSSGGRRCGCRRGPWATADRKAWTWGAPEGARPAMCARSRRSDRPGRRMGFPPAAARATAAGGPRRGDASRPRRPRGALPRRDGRGPAGAGGGPALSPGAGNQWVKVLKGPVRPETRRFMRNRPGPVFSPSCCELLPAPPGRVSVSSRTAASTASRMTSTGLHSCLVPAARGGSHTGPH